MKHFAAVALLFACYLPVHASAQTDSEQEVRQTVNAFLAAFNNLDWIAFRQLWVAEPVIVMPAADSSGNADRVDPGGFDARWQSTFAEIRERAKSRGVVTPPYQKIEPRDLRIDFPHPDVAVVSFNLGSAQSAAVGRRMFVLARQADRSWKITHFHGSTVQRPPK